MPPSAEARSGALARFAYRGWAAGVAEPVRLALCNIPDTPAARERFAQLFGASVMTRAQLRARGRAARMSGADAWEPGALSAQSPGAPPIYLVDGLVADPRINKLAGGGLVALASLSCDPTAIQCDDGSTNDPYCDPYAKSCSEASEDPADPYNPPPDELQPGTTLDPYSGAASLSAAPTVHWWCTITAWKVSRLGTTNILHSTHQANCYAGYISSFVLRGNIQRRTTIFWVIPWWSTVANSPSSTVFGLGIASQATTATCVSSGYYRSNTILRVTDIYGTETVVVTSPLRYRRCPFGPDPIP